MTAWPKRLLFDGAMGTELIRRGMVAGKEAPEAWNVERAEAVRGVYESYFAAGARAVQTNTFGANRVRLSRFGRQTEVRPFNLAGALLAREVRPTGALVIGNLGPTGAIPPPEGNADLIELEDAYAEQAMALAEGGVDALHIETMYHPKEARAAIRGAREGAPSLRVIASMTCRRHGNGFTTPLGFSPEVMLAAFLEEGVQGVGANCTLTPADMLELVRAMRARTELPIFAKPTLSPNGTSVLPPQELGSGALALFAAGAYAVGGCCGAGPDAIRAARAALDGAPGSLEELNIH